MGKRGRRGAKSANAGRVLVERRDGSERRGGTDRRTPDDHSEASTVPAADQGVARPLSYASRLRQLAHLELEETQAESLWRDVARHRRELFRRLNRDVGQRVALLDFILNVRPQFVEPTIIEANTLDAIKRDAVSDSLTGLYNRHYFDEALRREGERSHRYGIAVSLLLLDLDEFKEVNDEYGHRVGDKVLQTVGALILKHVRAADIPCRYGGDEFAIILSATSQAEGVTVAERIRIDVADSFERQPVCGQFLEVSVSGGLASLPLDATTPDQLFLMADGALYEAKHSGSNRIATPPASHLPEPPQAA
jgi:diguanylate cyclase (GGDEF)-like protein